MGLVVLGLALRLSPLTRDALHQDEALYGFWGRLISSGRDPWLATAAVDKPPLVPYLIAASLAVFGSSAFAIRLPGLAASLVSIPLTYALGRRLYGGRVVGLAAAGVMALTPYPVLFGATAFTDPILVACWLAACFAALNARWGWTGLFLGLAFASKQHTLVLAPLVIGMGAQRRLQQAASDARWSESARFLLGLVPLLAAVFAWDAVRRAQGATTGFWGQGVASFGGLRLIWAPELGPRWRAWLRLGGYLLAWPWAGGLFMIGAGALLGRDLTCRRRTWAAWTDLLLGIWVAFYLLVHWLVAVPVWDRYLLPLLPVLGLLLGRIVTVAVHPAPEATWRTGQPSRPAALGYQSAKNLVSKPPILALVIVLLASGGLMAAGGRIPVGGDHGAYDGLGQVVAYLQTLPAGTVLYDRWLSWHYDFYLFDAYLYRAGFPTPAWLARDAAAFYDGQPRYLVVPSWESPARLERALAGAGLEMSPALTTRRRDGTVSFVIYEIGARDNDGP